MSARRGSVAASDVLTNANAVLLELADRCEKAAGPNYNLDREIANAVGLETNDEFGTIIPPRFTASLDAAMTLVPENADVWGERFRLEHWNDNGIYAPHVRASAWVAGARRAYAATPALALCAASLRARASSVKD